MTNLVNHPNKMPSRKVAGGGVGGTVFGPALAVVLFWFLKECCEMEADFKVVAAAGSLIGVIASFIGAYLTRERGT